MLYVRCAFCHQPVFRLFYFLHRLKHTKRLADGQMTDHITVQPTNRYQGSLDGIPRGYVHPLCGVATGMPEEIIRSYLANPFLYNNNSFCCGCNTYICQDQLFWTETGESLDGYFRQLQEEYLRTHGKPPPRPLV